jgi:peroxiredoxin family protein
MTIQKILVPYNFSITDEKALAFIINTYAAVPDVKITLFHTFTPLPEIDVAANPEIRKMMSGMTHLANELNEKENGLRTARNRLLDYGFAAETVDFVFKKKSKSSADEIIDQVKEGEYNVLILSRKPGKVSNFFARSIHNRVLAVLTGVTVCITT